MSEDRLFAALKAEIGTPAPVRPMRPGRGLSMGLLGLAILGISLLMSVLGLRPDRQLLGDGWLWGLSLVQISIAVPLWRVAVGEVLPGRRRSLGWLSLAAVLAIAGHWVAAFLTHQHSPTEVPTGLAWKYGTFCFLLELALGLPMVSWAFWRLRRGLVTEPLRVALAAGLAAGVMGDGLWRLFCPYSDAHHILAFHTPGIVVVVLVASFVGWIWQRQQIQD